MAIISNLDPLFEVGIEARPSNYLVNHVAWTAPSESIEWTDLCLVRNTSGHPRNINDGVAIFSRGTDTLTLVVAQIYGTNSINNVSYAGGGLISLTNDYETYDNLTATGDTKGAKFKVTRSSADLGKVIQVEIISFGENYSVSDVLTIPKASIGYDATLHPDVTDLVITVTALGGIQAGVKPVSGTGFTIKTYSTSVVIPDSGTFTYEGVEAYSTGNSKGKGATFDVTRVGNGTTSTTTVALRASGSGYKVGDILRIPSRLIGRPSTVELGIDADYHIYDTGADLAETTNPGSNVVGQYLNNPRYYYSLFLRHNPVSGDLPVWKKIAESESFAIKDNGTLETVLYHLPTFYKKDSQGKGNQDLTDYLSLFAFHLDTYLAANSSVFNVMDPDVVDEKLLKLLIKQLGGTYENVSGVSQARTLVSNLIRNYKLAGSSSGVTSYLETHSGYGISLEASTNYLLDYNTSSFVESTGSWYPGNSAAYGSTAPFLSNLTLTGPIDGSFASYANYSVTLTSASSLSKTVTVLSTSTIKSGSRVIVTAGTGAFAVGTVVTSVDSPTTFHVNVAPTTALSGATIKFSDNLNSGMGKITVAAASSPMFYMGPKTAQLTATAASGTTVVTIKPNVAAVNDYVLLTAGNSDATIPEGTYVTAVNSSTSAVTLSNKLAGAVASATSLILSPPPAADLPSASVARQAVEAGKPYAFGAYFSAGGGTTRTTEVKITWYDIYGTALSTTAAGTLSTATQSSASSWYLNNITGVAPAKATYAEPQFTINNLAASYYVDAAQFNHPLSVSFKSLTSGTVTLSTDVPHNYVAGNSVSVSGLDAPFDGTFTITNVSQDFNTGVYTFQYVTTGTDTSGLCSGYVASVPSTFEDARKLKLVSVANRVNLVHNPSFEINTTSWAGTTDVTISRVTSDFNIGTASLQAVVASAAATNSAVVSDSTANPIKIFSGNLYTFSGYVKVTAGASATYDVYVDWYDDESSTSFGTLTGTATTITTSSGWVRLSVTGEAPSGATRAKLYFRKKTAMTNTATFLLDNVLVEKYSALGVYFDGAYDGQNYSTDRDSMWEGAEHLSPSHLYIDRVSTFGKLDSLSTDMSYYA